MVLVTKCQIQMIMEVRTKIKAWVTTAALIKSQGVVSDQSAIDGDFFLSLYRQQLRHRYSLVSIMKLAGTQRFSIRSQFTPRNVCKSDLHYVLIIGA